MTGRGAANRRHLRPAREPLAHMELCSGPPQSTGMPRLSLLPPQCAATPAVSSASYPLSAAPKCRNTNLGRKTESDQGPPIRLWAIRWRMVGTDGKRLLSKSQCHRCTRAGKCWNFAPFYTSALKEALLPSPYAAPVSIPAYICHSPLQPSYGQVCQLATRNKHHGGEADPSGARTCCRYWLFPWDRPHFFSSQVLIMAPPVLSVAIARRRSTLAGLWAGGGTNDNCKRQPRG